MRASKARSLLIACQILGSKELNQISCSLCQVPLDVTCARPSETKGLSQPPRPETAWRQCHQLWRKAENISASFAANKSLLKPFTFIANRNGTRRRHLESIWTCKYIKLIYNKFLWSRGHEFLFPTNLLINISMIHWCHYPLPAFYKENTSSNKKHPWLLLCQRTSGKFTGEVGGEQQQEEDAPQSSHIRLSGGHAFTSSC